MPRSEIAYTVEEAEADGSPDRLPGGHPAGLYHGRNRRRLCLQRRRIRGPLSSRGLSASLVSQVLIEESVLGWEELELEVVRDAKNQMITVCFIENVDAMGVHTGDSFCTAPMLTIIPEAPGTASEVFLRHRGSHRGHRRHQHPVCPRPQDRPGGGHRDQSPHLPLLGPGVQGHRFPHRPGLVAYWPPASPWTRSPTGGTGPWRSTPRRAITWWSSSPAGPLRSSRGSEDKLGTQMRAVGEVMSIGKNYKEAFQKAIRSLENGRYGLGFAKDFNEKSLDELLELLAEPSSERQFIMYEALRKGADIEALLQTDPYQALVHPADEGTGGAGRGDPERTGARTSTDDLLHPGQEGRVRRHVPRQAPGIAGEARSGTAGQALGLVAGMGGGAGQRGRKRGLLLTPPTMRPIRCRSATGRRSWSWAAAPTGSARGSSSTTAASMPPLPSGRQGIEIDHGQLQPRDGSTDYDTSDKLYFEPLTVEDVLCIYEKEKPEGVIVQFGGQTPLNIAGELDASRGEDPRHLAGDHRPGRGPGRFPQMMRKLGIPSRNPAWPAPWMRRWRIAARIGYPLMVRPSYVLGGRGHGGGPRRGDAARVRRRRRWTSRPNGRS